MSQTTEQMAEQVLNEQVRPYLIQHQGNIRLIEIKDGVAYVKLLGQCMGCASADNTMQDLVSSALLKVDGIDRVELVMDTDQALIDLALRILRKESPEQEFCDGGPK